LREIMNQVVLGGRQHDMSGAGGMT
jgi:hypothetical protein